MNDLIEYKNKYKLLIINQIIMHTDDLLTGFIL